MDQVTWWTAFGAIAQAVGAIATFVAVLVSLYMSRSERAFRGKGNVKILLEAHPYEACGTGTYHLAFDLENTGLRILNWESISWRSGWSKWVPEVLSYQWALQNDQYGSPFVKQRVEPAMTGRVLITIRAMKPALLDELGRSSLFRRELRFLGYAPLAAFANVAGRKPIRLKVHRDVAEFLRSGYHPDRLDVSR